MKQGVKALFFISILTFITLVICALLHLIGFVGNFKYMVVAISGSLTSCTFLLGQERGVIRAYHSLLILPFLFAIIAVFYPEGIEDWWHLFWAGSFFQVATALFFLLTNGKKSSKKGWFTQLPLFNYGVMICLSLLFCIFPNGLTSALFLEIFALYISLSSIVYLLLQKGI